MTFISISFEHNCLRQSISCKIYFLDIICCLKIWIRCHTGKVHNNTIVYKIFDIICTLCNVHDISECKSSIIPVDVSIAICISCDAYFCTRKITGRITVACSLSIFISTFVIPYRTCKTHGVCTAVHRNSLIILDLRVTPYRNPYI